MGVTGSSPVVSLPPPSRSPLSRLRDSDHKLILGSIGWANVLAGRWSWVGRDDLRQVAYLGLCKAMLRWQPGGGASFNTYSTMRIRSDLSRFVYGNRLIRRPGWETKHKKRYGALSCFQFPVSETISKTFDYENDEPIASWEPSCDDHMAERKAVDDELAGILKKAMLAIRYRERRVLELRFGLNNQPALTLSETGKIIGVTRERVRQIEMRGLRRLGEVKQIIRLIEDQEFLS